MKKILLLLFVLSAIKSSAQQKLSGNVVIENVLNAINAFQRSEERRDSLLSHPLGSNQEEDFARRFCLMKDSIRVLLPWDHAY